MIVEKREEKNSKTVASVRGQRFTYARRSSYSGSAPTLFVSCSTSVANGFFLKQKKPRYVQMVRADDNAPLERGLHTV